MLKLIFNYTVLSEGKKEACRNFPLLYGSLASQLKATQFVFVLRLSSLPIPFAKWMLRVV